MYIHIKLKTVCIPHLLCPWTLLRLHRRLLPELLRQWSDISKLLVFLLLESLSGALNHLYFSKISDGSAPSPLRAQPLLRLHPQTPAGAPSAEI